MQRIAKSRAKSPPKAPAAAPVRLVYEVYGGNNDDFDGAIVVERTGGAERILFYFQSKGAVSAYENDAEREADRLKMVSRAQAVAADQKNFRRFRADIIDYRRYGAPDSKERMPNPPYEWTLWEPGQYLKGQCRRIFPFCPFRFEEMLIQRCAHFLNAGLPGKVKPYQWFEHVYDESGQAMKGGAK